MISNKLFLLMSIVVIVSLNAMDNSGMRFDIYGMNIKPLSAITPQELEDNKGRCLALKLNWPENITHVLEINPIFYGQKGKPVYCLSYNPRELNRAIINYYTKTEDKARVMRTLMTPQLPKFIPFTQEALKDFNESRRIKSYLGEQPFTINLMWNQHCPHLIQKEKAQIAHCIQNNKNYLINACMITTTFGWGLAAILCFYVG